MPAYTVGQTFEFAARCQMPEGSPEHKVQERVNTVLELLGLSHRRDTIVGNNLLRGISGGEKKRVTIGIEFTKGPGLYLLDEPSTGLDAKTAIDIFKSVRIIADMGPPVICTLKQPSVELFNLFDKLMIMSQGVCVCVCVECMYE
jgi:ATP-binding cassette, subfamily G (WHITE), member 2, PDR